MHVALIGATGRAGSRLAAELVSRGHGVRGIAQHLPGEAPPGITFVTADATKPDELAPQIAGCDAVISATRFDSADADALIAAIERAKVPRLLVVGGAGSLEIAPGKILLDSEGFPEAFKVEAGAGARFLDRLRVEHAIDWTFISPAADFAPGARTGHFRLGGNQLLTDDEGRSWISMEDFAIAMIDELEHPAHSRQRFTVGY